MCFTTYIHWLLIFIGHATAESFPPAPNGTLTVINLCYLTGSKVGPSTNMYYLKPGQAISGAITFAVDEINSNPNVLPGYWLTFTVAETYGVEAESIRKAVECVGNETDVFIGPQETCITEGRVAASFNKPMISYYCTSTECSNKDLYPTFARTKPHDSFISLSLVSLLTKFDWKKVVFVYNRNPPEKIALAETIQQELKENNLTVTASHSFVGPFFPDSGIVDSTSSSPFIKIVEESYRSTRVYVMLANSFEFEGLLVALKVRGLLDTGDYVVVGVDTTQYNPKDPFVYIEGMIRENQSDFVSSAFRGFLLVTPAPPVYPEFDIFRDVVNQYLVKPPFNYEERRWKRVITAEATYLYDAVWLYARSAHKAIESGDSPGNGTAIMSYIKGATYKSAMGYNNYIDEKGDCQGNFTLLAQKCLVFDSGTFCGMFPIGSFQQGVNTSIPILVLNDTLDWIGGSPPLGEPGCGFLGERCLQEKKNLMTITGAAAGAIVVIIAISGFILAWQLKNRRYEQELASLLWKIDIAEIDFGETRAASLDANDANTDENGANDEQSCANDEPNCANIEEKCQSDDENYDNDQLLSRNEIDKIHNGLFIDIGCCDTMVTARTEDESDRLPDCSRFGQGTRLARVRGHIVILKMIPKKTVDLSRTVQKELKVMRDIRHPNLCAFIGACVDPNHVCILMESCSRGSLQDILLKPEIKLDTLFNDSFVFDLIAGMTYLHDSEVRYHGHLKSTNCVVDSRWQLKVTDFGLREFRSYPPQPITEEDEYYRALLWTAPEHLRLSELVQIYSDGGSAKGDIYSFAIILYEISVRQMGGYEAFLANAKETVQRVMGKGPDHDSKDRNRPSLKESLMDTAKCITDCIGVCWLSEPIARPDFKHIYHMLKPLMGKRMDANIVDTIVSKLESYATNLEVIVDARTKELNDEKKKTEQLLHRMLPSSVAEVLKQGGSVAAETFEMVTIYFSDICGFTQMSSESTPMEVVTLLNSLYTMFDNILEQYNVYKVETIGDAYMVVSGLPNRDVRNHAAEIASMSLNLLQEIKQFKIPHRPADTLKLRIGIHSGQCAAGVVGKKMPRYCLFGDTVNTASRMESTGEALKIHCSAACKALLDKASGYHLEERGMIYMKGKGEVLTYWLCGESHHKRKQLKTMLSEQSPFFPRMRQLGSVSSLRSPPVARNRGRNSIDATSFIFIDSAPPDCRQEPGLLSVVHYEVNVPVCVEEFSQSDNFLKRALRTGSLKSKKKRGCKRDLKKNLSSNNLSRTIWENSESATVVNETANDQLLSDQMTQCSANENSPLVTDEALSIRETATNDNVPLMTLYDDDTNSLVTIGLPPHLDSLPKDNGQNHVHFYVSKEYCA